MRARASPRSRLCSILSPLPPHVRALSCATFFDPSATTVTAEALSAWSGERIAEPSFDRIKRISFGNDRANKPFERRQRLVFGARIVCSVTSIDDDECHGKDVDLRRTDVSRDTGDANSRSRSVELRAIPSCVSHINVIIFNFLLCENVNIFA